MFQWKSKTEQNHLSPTGAGRVSKTENSKYQNRTGRAEGLEPCSLGVGLETGTTTVGGSPKSKTGWACLAMLVDLESIPAPHKSGWSLSIESEGSKVQGYSQRHIELGVSLG